MTTDNERKTPLSDEVSLEQFINGATALLAEIKLKRKRRQHIPASIMELDYGHHLSPDMSDERRVELVDQQHELFREGLARLPDFYGRAPRTITVDGQAPDGQDFKALVTRLHEQLAFVEYIYVGQGGRYLQERLMFWVGKEAINNFLKRQVTDNESFFTAWR